MDPAQPVACADDEHIVDDPTAQSRPRERLPLTEDQAKTRPNGHILDLDLDRP
jgi:hypothetical protein